jgi:two-component system, NarL family, response regulator DevR
MSPQTTKTKTKPIRLLLVDDHQLVRAGLRSVLAKEPAISIVGEAATSAEAVAEAQRLKPDVVLLDMRLPDGNGVDACREIRQETPKTGVLFLTSYGDDDAVLAAIVAGARGYLLKEVSPDELVRSIKLVAEGKPILDPTVTQRVLDWMKNIDAPKSDVKVEGLSPQEQRIVALIAEGQTNKEIGVALKLSEKTVKNYLANIFQKLQITRRSQAAAFFAERQKR